METLEQPHVHATTLRYGAAATLDVAVVMATYKRPDLLERCLNALVAQTLDRDRYEIVVVDDGHDPATRAMVETFAARTRGRPAVHYRESQGTRGPAGARNVGWRASTAPLIAFTDDDTVPDADWLLQGLRAMAPGRVAVGGRLVVPTEGPPTDHARMTQGLENAEFATANVFVRRTALERVGGFDERFTRAWREDSDLHFSLLQLGDVGHAERAVVVHPVRPAPWGISLGQQKNVCFDALLYKKHPGLYRQRIRAQPPWNYVGIVAASFAAVVAALAGSPAVAALLLLLALAGIARFAAQRLRGASHSMGHVTEMVLTSVAIPYLALWWRLVGAWRFRVFFL